MADVARLVVALVVALVATPIAARVARAKGIVDRPGPLKIQRAPVPYLGGVAVFVSLAVPVALARLSLLVPLALLTILGLVDDVGEIPPRLRLLSELGIGLVAGVVAPAPGAFVTAALVVGLVNAINLLDGLDGLAGGVAVASALGFAAIGGPASRAAGLALSGALAGFLWFNRPPARIFLGDAGAYLVGGALAVTAALALREHHGGATWVAVPLLVALPLFDTTVAVVRRRRAGRPLFAGDRSHVYDQLVDRGRTRVQAVLDCVALQVVFAALGVAALHVAPAVAVAFAVAGAVALVVLAAWGGFIRTEAR